MGKNTEEAKSIVLAAINQMTENPSESVGIVAMNAKQADAIEMELEQQIADSPAAQRAYEKNLSLGEPLFVKNLENVQGDERDVMMISMTYGPEEAGSPVMAQRFGPINQDVGWRRLNVLFTRSKKRMIIFSSMDSGHVRTSETSKRGVVALRGFLEYCESGRLTQHTHTGKPADSDFEIAVMDMLAAHGYQCEPQLGVAGYFLDIAVKDPGQPGRFLMGIECDGASYHSAKSARDRDRLRQAVLEGLGWNISRIWSTDWFKHPEAQLAPILEQLDNLRTEPPETPLLDDTAFASQAIEASELSVAEARTEYDSDLVTESSEGILERLKRFENEVIRVKHPLVEKDRRLLRPELLEVLLRVKPESKAEFLEAVPKFLREGTAPEDAQFLGEVVDLIALYG